jgi:hypothetical protein
MVVVNTYLDMNISKKHLEKRIESNEHASYIHQVLVAEEECLY